MSQMKKVTDLSTSTLKSLVGVNTSGNCVLRSLTDAIPEFQSAIFSARQIATLETFDAKIPAGIWRLGSVISNGTLPDTQHDWRYGALIAININAEQLHFCISYFGGIAYRAITDSGDPKRWLLIDTQKF